MQLTSWQVYHIIISNASVPMAAVPILDSVSTNLAKGALGHSRKLLFMCEPNSYRKFCQLDIQQKGVDLIEALAESTGKQHTIVLISKI